MSASVLLMTRHSLTQLSPAHSLGELTVVSAEGTESGTTALTVTPEKAEGQLYKYKIGTQAQTVTPQTNVKNWSNWDGESDITAETGKVITVVECGKNYYADAAGHATVVSKEEEEGEE